MCLDVANDVKSHELFTRWTHKDCVGKPPSDICLLVLDVLRYLGRALTFDDLEELTYTSAEVHRQFCIAFLKCGNTISYNRHVVHPATDLDVSAFEKVFALAGFNGCVGYQMEHM